jgi:hypothetical protein
MKNDPRFLPSRTEIISRCEAQEWMFRMEWDVWIIDSIMMDDMPSIENVRFLVYKYGPDKALHIIRGWLKD